MSPPRERELRKAQMAAAAARRAEPDARPAGRTAIRSKPVRITLDLSPELYRELTGWADEAAIALGVPRVSLADAVQAAHREGFSFGQGVARDAPALWLEAVLARKPRMPSDLEARLLQDSSLPIDSLLHDEVRHALRRGFWDALERVRH